MATYNLSHFDELTLPDTLHSDLKNPTPLKSLKNLLRAFVLVGIVNRVLVDGAHISRAAQQGQRLVHLDTTTTKPQFHHDLVDLQLYLIHALNSEYNYVINQYRNEPARNPF